jgi:hypothetical protein
MVCRQQHNKREALRRKAAMTVCRRLESHGVNFMDGDRPVTADELAAQLLRVVADKIG